MTEIEKLKQQLQEQERLASLGMLSAGIAHELQNPLNFVINFSRLSDQLVDDLTDILGRYADRFDEADRADLSETMDNLRQNMKLIAESGQRANSIIQGILLVSRRGDEVFVPSDVCRIVREYVSLSYHAMRASHPGFNVAISEQYQTDMPLVKVIPQDLSRAVLNVVSNACYAVWMKSQQAGDGYSPEISISVTATASHLVITTSDNGTGMSDEVKRRLFENFFTTKPIGQGTGLGMGITRHIVEHKHHGQISFTSTEGEGTTFTITIPIEP